MKLGTGIFRSKLIGMILLLSAAAACTGAAVVTKDTDVIIVCVTAWLICCCLLYRIYGNNARKISYTFDALRSHDFTFQFDTSNVRGSDRLVNESLNRIRAIMQEYDSDTRERDRFYEAILDAVDTGILVVDMHGNVLQKNHRASQLSGLDIITHVTQFDKIAPDFGKTVSEILPGERRQVTLQDETGQKNLSISATSAIIRKEPVRILAINDIDNELSQNEMDSWIKLIRVLTHEIMNSITPVTSLSATLMEKAEPGSAMRDGLEVIHHTGKDLISFVENYRKFTHVPTPSPTLFYVNDLVTRAIALAQEQTAGKGIQINAEITPPDLLVYADEKLISHVLTNLLKNAVQAITESGQGNRVNVNARNSEDDHVIIDVSNDGPVIPEDIASHIFVPFFTTKKNGTGIGLSLSRQIMRMSGGTLSLRTDRTKGITTFRMTFD